MTWYQHRWFYIEEPLPWLLVTLYATILIAIIGFAVLLGIWWF